MSLHTWKTKNVVVNVEVHANPYVMEEDYPIVKIFKCHMIHELGITTRSLARTTQMIWYDKKLE